MLKTFNKKRLIYLIAIIAACLLPVIFSSSNYIFSVINFILIYAIAATGLDILFGYTGLISLGHAGFYAIGAYVSALLSRDLGMPVVLTLIIAAIIATLIAVLLAWPSSKLKGHFLALVTIAFGEIIYLLIIHSPGDVTAGFTGLYGIPELTLFGYAFESNASYFYVLMFVVVLFMFVKSRIIDSKVGRAFIALRDNQEAANGMGINVRKYRVTAFAISAFMTSVAGSLYAHMIGFISPETFTMSNISIPLVTIVLFGGLASQWGPVIGAIVVTLIGELLQMTGTYQMILYGLFIVVVLLFMPQGIMKFSKGIFEKIQYKFNKGGKASVKD